jgi:hypothetical protein
MRILLGRLLERLFPAFARGRIASRTLAHDLGHARSIRTGHAVDAAGAPIPWYTYPAIEYLRRFDLRSRAVFEFGGGNSSLFWAARAARVVTVESDPAWHARLEAAAAPNLQAHLRADMAAYTACLAEQGTPFDVIAIDGRWRRSCARVAPACLAEGGLIVLDNSERYPRTTGELRSAGFFQIDFSGFGPVAAFVWTTSLFLRAGAGLQRGFTDAPPIGAVSYDGGEDA